MTTNALVLSYRPMAGGSPAPALGIDLAVRPKLAALGLRPGQPFDPRPFAATFPADADQAWVFAEWVAALQALVDDGATADELRAWLDAHADPVFELQLTNNLVLPVAPPLMDEPAAIEAVDFLLREHALGAVSRAPIRLPAGKQLRPDVMLLNDAGVPVLVIEVKQSRTDAGLAAVATLFSLASGEQALLDVNDPEMTQQLRDWLAARGLSRPSA